MTIRLLGVNHRTAPVELRERLAIAPESLLVANATEPVVTLRARIQPYASARRSRG